MENKINEILKAIRPEFDFSLSSDFISDGMIDSFDIVILVNDLEKIFSISIDGVDVVPENFKNIASIKNLLIKNGVKC
jgi:acyl carrier protein